VEVQLGDHGSLQCWARVALIAYQPRDSRVLTSSRMLSGDTKVGPWSVMLPHAPLRRVLIVTLSGALLLGLLTYVEYGVFVIPKLSKRDSEGGFPNRRVSDSRWRAQEVRHAHSTSG
jgi:hypothetical protein